MTNARSISAQPAAHGSPIETPAQVRAVLERAGVSFTGRSPPGGEGDVLPGLEIFDGKLGAPHAVRLRSGETSYLLACVGEPRRPHPADLEVLGRLLEGRALGPDFAEAQRYYVATREGLRTASERVRGFLEDLSVPRSAADACADVLYELAANALLDAPVTSAGEPKYAHRRDEPGLQISPEDAAVVAFGVQGARAFLGAVDRFGRLTSAPLARTLEGLGARATVNGSGGGAGLGMRRIVEQSALIATRVVPGRMTEVLCAVELGEIRRRASGTKSLFFCLERG